MKRLNIFVDETGEFGFGKGASELYGVSFTFHEHDDDIMPELNKLNDRFDGFEHRVDFDHKEKRLFQVSDMLTFIDKYDYKYKNKLPYTKGEKYFFDFYEIRRTLKEINKKRF